MKSSATWSVDHIGFAVKDIDEAIATYAAHAHTTVTLRERLEQQGVEIAFLSTGSAKIELLAALNSQSTLAKFLEKRGPGLHHIAYKVSNLEDELSRLSSSGVTLIDAVPRPGAGSTRIAFLHPSSFCGVLTELVEYPRG
jgi:methylmalonyl-CoA/ethylmalonyl-CoA epimerase